MEEENKELSIQETLQTIEELVNKLEQGDLGLEESFALYSKGVDLLKDCNNKIDLVEKQVLELTENGETRGFV